ncbi:hypothetical protein J6590_032378, partial [Homalodisca vitripennis]
MSDRHVVCQLTFSAPVGADTRVNRSDVLPLSATEYNQRRKTASAVLAPTLCAREYGSACEVSRPRLNAISTRKFTGNWPDRGKVTLPVSADPSGISHDLGVWQPPACMNCRLMVVSACGHSASQCLKTPVLGCLIPLVNPALRGMLSINRESFSIYRISKVIKLLASEARMLYSKKKENDDDHILKHKDMIETQGEGTKVSEKRVVI